MSIKKPTRYEPEQLKCSHCKMTDQEIQSLMVSHAKGRWISYDDYKFLKKEYNKLFKRTIIPIKNLTIKK